MNEDPDKQEEISIPDVTDDGRPETAWGQWKASPSPAAMSGVLKSLDPIISGTVSKFPGLNAGIARSHARSLAIQAVKTYDPSSGASLNTHVFNHLRPLSRFQRKSLRAVSIPREQSELVGRMLKFERDFQEENMREPTDEEVQDHLGVPLKKVHTLRSNAFFEFPEGAVENAIETDPGESRVARQAALVRHDLTPKDRLIMDHLMGAAGRKPLMAEEVASRLGLDPSYVRKRSKMIAERILEGVK